MSDEHSVIGMGQPGGVEDTVPDDIPVDDISVDETAYEADQTPFVDEPWDDSAPASTYDEPLMPPVGGDETTPPPGASDPNADVTAPPLPPTGELPPTTLPDGEALTLPDPAVPERPVGDPGSGDNVIGAGQPGGPVAVDTTAAPPDAGTADVSSPEEPERPVGDPGSGDNVIGAGQPGGPETGIAPGGTGTVVFDPVDGMFENANGMHIDPQAAGVWHDGTTVYGPDGEVLWTGNNPVGAPIEVPAEIAHLMETMPATVVEPTLPPALPTQPPAPITGAAATEVVRTVLENPTGDTMGTLAGGVASLTAADGHVECDALCKYMVEHANELGLETRTVELGDDTIARLVGEQPVRILVAADGGVPEPATITRVAETHYVATRESDNAPVAVDLKALDEAFRTAATTSVVDGDDGGLSRGTVLVAGGALMIPAVVAGSVLAAKNLRRRGAVARLDGGRRRP